MTKAVAAFRSRVIGDSRHTVRLDENSHLVLFPTFSRYITSSAISALIVHGHQWRHLEESDHRERAHSGPELRFGPF
jgi:hypothetical protein